MPPAPVERCVARLSALRLGAHALWAAARTRRPSPAGMGRIDHSRFRPVLSTLADNGLGGVAERSAQLFEYLDSVAGTDPDGLTREEALAFWINLYNACAIHMAVEAYRRGDSTVLRVPGAFSRPEIEIAGEELSLNAIENGKVRRFGDPRIHAALVCGSLSCPTLRPEPYVGQRLDETLEEQMLMFMSNGGVVTGDDGEILLSRIFLWYGPDFVRPQRMPSFFPVSAKRVLGALRRWLPPHLGERDEVGFQAYDWGLSCEVR